MEVQELVRKLSEANAEYRRGNPIMSDEEFDKLENELLQLDPENDWFKSGVNDETPKDRKRELPYPMMSLNKVKTIDELIEWARQFTGKLVITPKLDGLSVGFFTGKEDVPAFTRGDGKVGQDCSAHVKYITNKVASKEIGEGWVRGEIIFTNDNFNKFKERHPEAKNSRNSATGLINGDFDRAKIVDYSDLSIVCYNFSYDSYLDKTEQLDKLNLNAPLLSHCDIPYITCTIEDLQKEGVRDLLFHLFNEWREMFPMDGLVFDVDDWHQRSKAGEYANGNPKYAIAYKDPEFTEKGLVTVDHIELQLNREGVATPVVYFDRAVNLSGADIQKVNGINMQYIHDWGIFDKQALTVVRSGEVIPKIVAVNGVRIPFRDEFKSDKAYKEAYNKALEARHLQLDYQMFQDLVNCSVWKCPFCLEELEWDENHVQMVCKNPDCKEKKFQSIVAFCKIAGVKDCGEDGLRGLYDNGVITDIDSLFELKFDSFANARGWGETSINSLLSEIERIRTTLPFAQLAHASGMFGGLGQKTIQSIIDNIVKEGEEDEILSMVGWTIEDLCKVPGVQIITASDFIEGVRQFIHSPLFEKLKFSMVKSPVLSASGKMSGKSICFTGFRSAEMKSWVEQEGGKVVDSVTKKTTMLVTNDLDDTSSKMKKAKELGILIVSKLEFASMME